MTEEREPPTYKTFPFDDVTNETERAIGVKVDDDLHWFPKSVLEEVPSKDGGPGEMGVAEWFLKKEGLV